MKTFAFSDLNRQSGDVLDAALAGPVTLTKHGKPKVVMMSIEEFRRLRRSPRSYAIGDAPGEIIDDLLRAIDAATAK